MDKKKKFLEKIKWVKDFVNNTIWEPQALLARIEALEQDVSKASPVQSNMKDFYESKYDELRDILNEAKLRKQQRAKRSERLLFLLLIPFIPLGLLVSFPLDIVNKSLGSQSLLIYVILIILMSLILYLCFFLYYNAFNIIRNRIIIPNVMFLHKDIKFIIYLIISVIFIYGYFDLFYTFFIIEAKLNYKDLLSSLSDFFIALLQVGSIPTVASIGTEITILLFIFTVFQALWRKIRKIAKNRSTH